MRGLTHVHQCFLNMRGSDIGMVCFGMLDGFLQMLDSLGHMLVLFGVLFFPKLARASGFLRHA